MQHVRSVSRSALRQGATFGSAAKVMPLLLLGLAIVFAVLEPGFATLANLSNLVRQASILALAAFGQTLVVVTGNIDLSTGAAVALATMVAVSTAKVAGVAAGIAAGMLLGLVLGLVNGLLVARLAIPAFIATVGMMSYARGIAYYLGGGMPIEFPPKGYEFIGAGHWLGVPMPIWIALFVGIVVHLVLTRTAFGRRLFAVGGNEVAARLSGIPVDRYRLLAFALSGLMAGLTGVVLSSRVMSGQPMISMGIQFEAIAIVAIGGTTLGGGEGSAFRTALGTLFIAMLSNGLTLVGVSTFVQDIVVGAVIVGSVAIDKWQRTRSGK